MIFNDTFCNLPSRGNSRRVSTRILDDNRRNALAKLQLQYNAVVGTERFTQEGTILKGNNPVYSSLNTVPSGDRSQNLSFSKI